MGRLTGSGILMKNILRTGFYALFIVLISCPSPLEEKLTEIIETEVKEATASEYKLTVETPENGIINLSGTVTVKDDISQQILVTPYQTHAFIRWEKVSGSGTVVFSLPTSTETSFTVLGGDAVIRAVLEERPYVKYSTPSGTDISRNSKVLVKFSKEMKAYLFDSSTVKIIKENDESQVPGSLSYLNQVLTFVPDDIWDKYTRYSIQVSKQVTDEEGITLRENYISPTTFMTGSSEDSTPPESCIFYINNNTSGTPEWVNTKNITLTGIDGEDPLDGSGMAFVYISNTDTESNTFNQYEFTNTIEWELTDGDGEKTVYMDFEDACYNSLAGVSGGGLPEIYDSSSLISQTINLDTTPPAHGTTSSDSNEESGIAVRNTATNTDITYTKATAVDLSIKASDSGVDAGASSQMEMFISSDVSGTKGEWDPTADPPAYSTPVWETYNETKTWNIEPTEGSNKYFIIKFRDSLGNETSPTFDYIKYDITPPAGSLAINNSSLYTNSITVTLNLDTTDSGVDYNLNSNSEMMISNDSGFSGAVWESFSETKSWDLPDADGSCTVYVKYRDSLGNEMDNADKYSAAITLDRALPTGSSIVINGGDSESGSTSVNLTTVSASDPESGVAEMAFYYTEVSPVLVWIPYASTAEYTPPEGTWNNGDTMQVYAWFKDNAGNISSAAVSDSISLNTTPPDGSFVIDGDSTYTNDTDRFVNINMNLAADNSFYRIANSTSALASTEWTEYGSTDEKTISNWQLTSGEGTKTVYAQFKSSTEIQGPVVSDSIILDITAPSVGTCYLEGTADDNSATNLSYVTIHNSVSGSPVYMRFKNESGGSWTGWYSYSSTKTYWYLDNDTVEGEKTVYFEYMDAAGNTTGGSHSDSIIIDKTAPAVSYFRIGGTDNPAKTNQTTVTLYSSVSDTYTPSNELQMNIGNYLDPWNGFETYTSSRTGWTLKDPTVDESKRIYCYYKDKAGNTSSASLYDTITLDTVAPSNVSVIINSGRTYAYNQSASLTINTDDTSTSGYQMRFRYIVGSSYIWTDYESYSTAKNVTLSDADGTKYLYVQLKDDAGNESGLYDHRDTIILDRPSVSYITRGRPGAKGNVKVFLNTVYENSAGGEDVRYYIYTSTTPDGSKSYRGVIYNSGDEVSTPTEEDEYYFHIRVSHYYDGAWHLLSSYFNGLNGIDRTGYSADVLIIYDDGDATDLALANTLKDYVLQKNFPADYTWASGTQPSWSVKIVPDTEISDTYSAENTVYGKPAIITPGLYYSYTDTAKDGWVRNIAAANQGIITMGSGAWVLDRIEENHSAWGFTDQAPSDVGYGESATFTGTTTMSSAKVCSVNTVWRTPLVSTSIGTSPTAGSAFQFFSTTDDSYGRAVYRSGGANPTGGYNYAQVNSTSYYYPIVRQGRYMFWGWSKIPYVSSKLLILPQNGRMVFNNAVAYMDGY